MKVFTDLELLEASFVGIPSNRHGRAMMVAKSYNKKEVQKMDKEFTQKDVDSAVEKKVEELTSTFKKDMEAKDAELVKLKKEAEDAKAAEGEAKDKVDEAEGKVSDAEAKVDDAEKKSKDLEKELDATKKKALEKQKIADEGGDGSGQDMSDEAVDKAFKDGKVPFVRI